MIRLLYIGDHGSSGFGVVARGLLHGLHATGDYEILQLGINYNDLDGEPGVPWKVIPAGFYHPTSHGFGASDPYGLMKADKYAIVFDPDIVFINNDFPVANDYLERDGKQTALGKHRSLKILYAPLDSWPFPPLFAEFAKKFHKVISYSYFQLDLMTARDNTFGGTPVVYHGIDPANYFPMEKPVAKQMVMETFHKYNPKAKIPDLTNRFLVYFVGTNQWRKDLPALFRAFVAFNAKYPEAFLIPHTSAVPMSDSHGGWALYNLRDLTGLKNSVLYADANIFTHTEMNYFYNAADVLAFPTRGEGFGLPSFEAMATKTPVIATRFGPQHEIHTDGRGYFIDVEDFDVGLRHAWTYFARPSWRSLAERLEYVREHPEEATAVAEKAYEWVKDQTWESKSAQVDGIIKQCLRVSKALLPLRRTRKRRKKN